MNVSATAVLRSVALEAENVNAYGAGSGKCECLWRWKQKMLMPLLEARNGTYGMIEELGGHALLWAWWYRSDWHLGRSS